jgi:hypothetical protein
MILLCGGDEFIMCTRKLRENENSVAKCVPGSSIYCKDYSTVVDM